MRERVQVDAGLGDGHRVVAGGALDDRRLRRGAAPRRRPRRTSTRTRRTPGAGCAARPDRTWRRPRTRWSRRCRARSPSRRAARTGRGARRAPSRRAFFTGGLRCEVPISDDAPATIASICSARTFEGPHPNRPSAGRIESGSRISSGRGQRRSRPWTHDRSRERSVGNVNSSGSMYPREHESPSRLAAIAPSATLAVDAKAKALKAKGENVIGFGAGEPDFPTPAHIVEAAVAACRDPKNHVYTPAGGLPELKDAIAAKTLRDSGFACDGSQVLVTNGGKHAVFTAFAVLCDPGDEVICPAPYWTTYPEAITLADGVPVVIDTDDETGFKVTVEQLEAAYTDRTKALLFVSPDNPSGSVYTPGRDEGDRRVGARARCLGDHRRDLRAPHVRPARVLVDAHARARSGRAVPHPQRRRQDVRHDRVARRLADRPERRRQGRHQLPEPRHVERLERRPARRARRGVGRPRRRGDDARRRSSVAARRCTGCSRRSRASRAWSRRARSTASRTCRGCSARTSTVRSPDARSSWPTSCSTKAKVAFVPGEAFGAPGYARFSFALGDADLEEGIRRFAELVG